MENLYLIVTIFSYKCIYFLSLSKLYLLDTRVSVDICFLNSVIDAYWHGFPIIKNYNETIGRNRTCGPLNMTNYNIKDV